MEEQSPPIKCELPHLAAGFDNEVGEYVHLDQRPSNPSSRSRADKSRTMTDGQNLSHPVGQISSQPTFSGPSFHYESHQQQTGIPHGGLANTIALNRSHRMQYTGQHHGFVMPADTLNIPLTELDDVDFAAYPLDMEIDAESPNTNLLCPTALPLPSAGSFVDPTRLLGQSPSSDGTGSVQRMYPGMHSQLAAQAKAQQALKRDKAALSPPPAPPGQRALPAASTAPSAKDPHVEESISRLLNQMRKSSVASANDDPAATSDTTANLAKLKRHEDEMDEDERLLASEEGKKLSSKERRQLRNKVSARAFRSRRKEYIGQLEGEVASKSQEANSLRARNRELAEENSRLTDLTRMLLSSQAFSSFLSELNGIDAPAAASGAQQKPSQPPSNPTRKDVNPNEMTNQLESHGQQVGLVTVDESVAPTSLPPEAGSMPSWNAGLGIHFPVYSVTSLPDGPALQIEELSGKSHCEAQLALPVINPPHAPVVEDAPSSARRDEGIPAPPLATADADVTRPDFCPLPSIRPFSKLDGSVLSSVSSPFSSPPGFQAGKPSLGWPQLPDDAGADLVTHLQARCLSLDVVAARIAAMTSHLT